MAYANNSGLNEISELGVPTVVTNKHTQQSFSNEMDPKNSKIPKFSFSIRKTNGEKKPSPGSSPVSRSKSMKVQRTTIPLVQKKTKHSNSVDNDEEVAEAKQNCLLTPTNQKREFTKSQPNSRSTTPVIDNSTGSFSRSMTVSAGRSKDASSVGRIPINNGVKTQHTRSSSFSARERHTISNATGLKKPSVHTDIPDYKSRAKGQTYSPVESSRNFRKTPSNSKIVSQDESDGNVESIPKHGGILRSPDSRKSSLGSQSSGRRPSSMISFTEKSSDLNELASEITQMGDYGATPTGIQSSRSHISANRQAQVKSDGTTKVFSKLRPPVAKYPSDEGNRPSSVTTHHRNEIRSVSRPRSAADMHKIAASQSQQQSSKTITTTSRSSTPSSGRDTPQHKQSIAEEETVVPTQRNKGIPLTTPRRPLGAQSKTGRTPFFRPIKSSALSDRTSLNVSNLEDAVGLNELEGAVLLDAEDYRRMLQEVKTLKSVLLRLKRELAADGGAPIQSPSTVSTKSNVKVESPDKSSELYKEIEKLTLEKNMAKIEIENMQKKCKVMENKMDKLQQDLTESRNENDQFTEKLHFLESHRESLLDKVERLHADKHKLEDRLNTLEKSTVYESTVLNEEWMEGDLYDESINNGFNYDDEDATY